MNGIKNLNILIVLWMMPIILLEEVKIFYSELFELIMLDPWPYIDEILEEL